MSMVVKHPLLAMCLVLLLLGALFNTIIYYARKVIVSRCLIQHEVIATQLYIREL